MNESFKIGILSIAISLIPMVSFGVENLKLEENSDIRIALKDQNLEKMEDVKIYIDGSLLHLDKPLYKQKGYILVPMKDIFKELNANVIWESSTKIVRASKEDRKIELRIGDKFARINNEDRQIDVVPRLIEGSTYVPLRFVSEALMYEVDWNGKDRVVSIINSDSPEYLNEGKLYKVSKNYDKEYMNIKIIDDKDIEIEGKIGKQKDKWMFRISGKEDNFEDKVFSDIDKDGKYRLSYRLKDSLKDGEYLLAIYFKDLNESTYWSYYTDIALSNKGGELYFPLSPIYMNNYREYTKNSSISPDKFVSTNVVNEKEKNEIKSLALDITKDSKDDYERLIKINDWVAENIYYNWDGYLSGNYGSTDAYGTLKTKKSVCQGYSELTDALLKSLKIPSRIVTGYALGVDSGGKDWSELDHSKSNHAWNESYVDGRWIILDTSWNSRNKYENGKFNKKPMSHRYFDPTLEAFSSDHKIIKIK